MKIAKISKVFESVITNHVNQSQNVSSHPQKPLTEPKSVCKYGELNLSNVAILLIFLRPIPCIGGCLVQQQQQQFEHHL